MNCVIYMRTILFSKKMSIYFNIVGIRKYVIKYIYIYIYIYITSVAQFHEIVISNDCITKTKAPEARD